MNESDLKDFDLVVSLVIPGVPTAKGRPRFARAGKFVRVYTPKETVSAENFIRLMFYENYPLHTILTGALRMDLFAFMPIPKSTPKKLAAIMETERVAHIKKPDRSNIMKLVEDALHLCYVDDCQIYCGWFSKHYSPFPRLEIKIYKPKEQVDSI